METNKIATLLASIDTIPTLPAIVGQVTQTIANPESSASDLMEIIHPDQSLTLKILRIANSAFYGRMREVRTLEQAIMVLGFDEVRNLVLLTALFNNFPKLKVAPFFDVGKFWEHSFVCGLAARMIAKKMKLPEGEFFVAGLMHDIGKLVICLVLPAEFGDIVETAGSGNLKTHQLEQEILGIAHDEVGGRLVKRWMLPQDLVVAVGYHHRPDRTPAQTAYPIVVHLADVLAHNATSAGAPDDTQAREGFFPPGVVNAAQSMGISIHRELLDAFTAELAAQMQDQAGILDIFLP